MAHPSQLGPQPEVVRLFLLGGFRAERDGDAVPVDAWQRRAGRQLVKLLATTPGHRLHREQVQELLWPELTPDSAAGALRKALHHARHALEPALAPRGDSSYLLAGDVVALADSSVWIDADAFEAQAELALAGGDEDALTQAVVAYEGELLPEDRYEEWTAARRLSLADLQTRLLLRLADLHEQAGHADAAVDRLRQVLTIESGREDVYRRLMRVYALAGHRHQALRQYQVCREAVSRELDAALEPETEALYQEILAGRVIADPKTDGRPDAKRPLPIAARRKASGMMVGRDQAFGSVIEAMRGAVDGRGGAMVIGGEAGVGKSRLAAEAARRAHDHGILVLWGAAYEQEGQLPYGAIVEALDGAVVSQAPEARERLIRRFSDLAGLLPSLRGAGAAIVAPHAPEEAGASRMRLFASMVALLDELRGGQPLMLVLDDLHAADASILQVFYHLARMAGERPWFLVGTYRAGAVAAGGELKRLLTAAVRERVASRIELDRLNPDETDRLVASLLPGGVTPPDLRADLCGRSLGNPLFVRELVQTMRGEGALALEDGRWVVSADATAAVPRQVRDVIDARVDQLGADARRALTLVAIAGTACSFRLLRDTGELTESSLLEALDRALAANLLDEEGDGYAFEHPLVRATLYEGLSRSRRARLHAALAAAIERQITLPPTGRPAPIEALAHHWAAAGESARAIPYLVEAADRAEAVYANAEAIDRLRQALLLRDELDGPLDTAAYDRLAILERLGDLHDLVGEAEAARAMYAAAIEAGDLAPLNSARLRRKCARQALFVGALAATDVLLDEAEAGLADAVDAQDAVAERARILMVRAQSDFLAFRFSEALATGEECLRLAEEAGSPVDVARACEMVAMACLPLGQWQRGLEFERRHGALTDLNGIVRDTADVHLCLSEYHLYGDRPEETAQAFLRALGEAERVGAQRSLALCHYYLGNMAYFRGRFPEGIARLDEAIQLYRQVGSASGEAIALMMRGVTLTALGRLDEARQGMGVGLDAAAHGTLRSHALIRLYAGLGRNRLDANDAIGAREYAERALALAEEPSDCICYAAFLPVATAAFALTGDLERASTLGDRALAQARAINTPPLLCMAQQANAMVHAMTGRWDTAFAALDDARRLAEEHGFPYELGRTLLMRSFVHMQRRSARDLAAASALTVEAWPILMRLGVRASAAQARSSIGFMRSQYGRKAARRKAEGGRRKAAR